MIRDREEKGRSKDGETERNKERENQKDRGKDECKEKGTKCFENRHGWGHKQRQKQDRPLRLPAN